MTSLGEIAEKKYKSRIRKFKKINKDSEDKKKFFEKLGASVEVFLPTKNPEEESDSIILYTDADGNVAPFAEYSYQQGENPPETISIHDKDLELLVNIFSDFKLELVEE
ncbi:MAG: hypothetical protein LBM96_01305 [Methanobrevibacter sp.]|nr:hypothetical protein [Candidatus Methanoflexus mossambicus]